MEKQQSLMPKIAELLGVEIGEVFKVQSPEGKIYEMDYMIDTGALYEREDGGLWYVDYYTLRCLLNGTEKLIRLPENEREYVK